MHQTALRGEGRATARQMEITHNGGGLMMAADDHVCIAIWESKPVRDLFEIQRGHLAAMVAREPGRACFMCIVSRHADAPDQDIRDASAKMIASHGPKLTGCACVIEGSGFRSAITRTVLTGIIVVIRSPVPYFFCESVTAACKWLETRAPRDRLTGLVDRIEAARATMKPRD